MRKMLTCMALAGISTLHAGELPSLNKDYYSLQIASGRDAQALVKLFQRYADLPFVRVEKRGSLYVLRAGFWDDQVAARRAVSGASVNASFLRVAVFRPDAIVQKNWSEVGISTTPTRTQPQEPSAPALVIASTAAADRPGEAALENRDLRPFNQADFVLAYDVLLGSGGLERAFMVAEKAVQHSPRDALWRRKLAKVAEWTGRPTLAAEQWQTIFQQGDHSEEVVSAVLRLAPLLEAATVALQAWAIRDSQNPLTDTQWKDIFDLYESGGQAALGSRFFEAQFEKKKTPLFLEFAAQLAENVGDDTRAESLFLRRMQLDPFSMDVLLRASISLIRRDRMAESLALMRRHDQQVAAQDTEFWRLLGQVAFEQRDYQTAQSAYERASNSDAGVAADWSRLVFLVRQKHPAQAAALAIEAYRRTGLMEHLLSGLEIYGEIGDFKAQAVAIKLVGREGLALAESDVRFLLLRARLYQKQNLPELAWADFGRALQIKPNSGDVLIPLLWFLIDETRTADLAAALKRYAIQATKDPAFWPAFAAANQVLDRHNEAVKWYRQEVNRDPQNPLVLLNYADALERTQRDGMASRIRRHAWTLLKAKHPQSDGNLTPSQSPDMVALARLALMNQPGDPGMNLVRQWVLQARGRGPEPLDEQTRVLVLGWAIVKEQFANAQSWMWSRYAKQSGATAPLWGESQVALQLGDTKTMARALDRNSEGLPTYNRYDTAYALGDVQQALDVAFKGMNNQENDEALHDRFRQHAPLHANYAQVELNTERPGSLKQDGLRFEMRLVLNPKLHLILGGSHLHQSSSNDDLHLLTSSSENLRSVEARWLGARGDSSLTLFRRNELKGITGLRLAQSFQWDRRISLDGRIDYGADSTLSEPLRVAGYENSLNVGLTYTLGKREYLRIAPRWARYYTQVGDYLGSGRSLDLEAGYRIRTEYPDWRVRAVASYQSTTADGSVSANSIVRLPVNLQTSFANGAIEPAGYFVPPVASSIGACLSMGENLQGQNIQSVYSRAWRPFFDLCLRHTEGTGFGYSGAMGLAGSVTGEDHLLLLLQNNKDTAGEAAATPSFTIRYRHYF